MHNCRAMLLLVALVLAVAGCSVEHPSTAPERTQSKQVAASSPGTPESVLETPTFGTASDPWEGPHESGRIVVQLAPGRTIDELLADYAAFEPTAIESGGYYVVDLTANDVEAVATSMLDDGLVDSAEPSVIYFLGQDVIIGFFETDPTEASGRVAPDTGWPLRTDLGLMHGWVTGEGSTIAILDSGLDDTASDAIVSAAVTGYDYVDNDYDPSEEGFSSADHRAFGHGTLVASLALQVAPDANIVPMRVMDPTGVVYALDVARALRDVQDMGVDVVNMSFGGHTVPDYVQDELQNCHEAGIVLVASAGNLGVEDDKHFPSASEYVCSVAATNAHDSRATFSSYGATIEIGAPGEALVGVGPERIGAVGSGTSFAAAIVSGALAAKLEAADHTPSQLRASLTNSGMPLIDGEYRDGLMAGRIDFDAFLFQAP